MRWFWQKAPEAKSGQFESVLKRLIASQSGTLFGHVSPQNCMQSPTVNAIVTAVSRRVSVTPVHVYRKSDSDGRASKERLPSHPVARLLSRPNSWQTSHDFWQDATSAFLRWGAFYAYKSRGSTGPIQELLPLDPASVEPYQDENTYQVSFRVSQTKNGFRDLMPGQVFHARGPARDFLKGDSPVNDIKTAIALEILAEKHGEAFFKNGAMPGIILSFLDGSSGFGSAEQEEEFIKSFKDAFGGSSKFSNLLLPPGMDKPFMLNMEHDKAQFLETRKYQRTVIAGAFGVPPHLVGDLERATFNNVEQQDQDFTLNVVMPVVRAFESAMERDLLTPADRAGGIVIRFNLDSTLRADFKSRQEGLWIQRQAGVINANEWREIEQKNPRDDDDGESYMHPSNMMIDGEEPDETEPDDTPGNQIPE